MRWLRTFGFLGLLIPAIANAQAEDAPGSNPMFMGIARTSSVASSTVTADVVPPEAPPMGPGDAWELYHDAFLAIVYGDVTRGRAMLRGVVAGYADHPATELAAEILAALDKKDEVRLKVPKPPPGDVFGPEGDSALARAELGVFQTIGGVAAGGLFCAAVQCDDARLFVGVLALGGAAGLTGALLGTEGGITPGRAQVINSMTGWGVFNGITLVNVLDTDDEALFGIVLSSQLVGLGTGLAISRYRAPTGGDVSRATSLGLWSGVLTLFLHGAAGFDADGAVISGSLMAVADLGLIAGGVLGVLDLYPMTRGRVLLIDAGGIVGALMGMGIPVLIQNEAGEPGVFFGSAIVGTLTGLVLATYFTRHWDVADVPDVSIGVLPNDGGASLMVGGRF